MSTAMIVQQASKLAAIFDIPDTGELVSVLKATAFKGPVSDAQMSALLIVANQYGLNPWTKEIYAFPDKNNGIVPVVGVDGWARIINGNPAFDGMEFREDAESCTCIIYRKDRSHPVAVTEYMAECNRKTGPWQSHPRRMLRHKATIQCARMAFGFAGIYDQDEAERITERDMGRATVVVSDVQPIDVQAVLAEIDTINDIDVLRAKKDEWNKTCVAANDRASWDAIKGPIKARAEELMPAQEPAA
jgi:phage recombination protein Bet